MKALALCAGYATRLYPLTENMPKALLKIKGETLLDRVVNQIATIDEVDEFIVISNDKFYNQFVEWKKTYAGKLKLTIINDGTTTNENRLGAIGDIQFAIDKLNIDDDILVTVSDNYFTYDISDYYNFYKSKNGSPCVIGCTFDDLIYLGNNFAVASLDNNCQITAMAEKPGNNPQSNFGVYATYFYPKKYVPLIKQYLDEGNSKDAPGNFPSWLFKKYPVYAYDFKSNNKNAKCYDIGTLDVYNKLNNSEEI